MRARLGRWGMSAAAVAMLITAAAVRAEQAEPPTIGEPAPAFELKDLDGKTHRLSDYKGQFVVLHFQSPTCPWDRAYQPQLNELARTYAEVEQEGEAVKVQFLAINANKGEGIESLQAYHEKTQMPYPILKDAGNKVADLYAAKTTPHIYIIDREGVLRYFGGVEQVPVSLKDVSRMEQYLEPVLKELLAGEEPAVTRTQNKGCGIKRE